MSKTIDYTESSGNVFADLGLSNPDERLQTAITAIMNQQSENELVMSEQRELAHREKLVAA